MVPWGEVQRRVKWEGWGAGESEVGGGGVQGRVKWEGVGYRGEPMRGLPRLASPGVSQLPSL